MVELAGEESLPEAWDDWTDPQQVAFLGKAVDEAGAQFLEHEGEDTGGDPGRELLNLVERVPRTMAFTVLAFAQMFQVMAIHAGDGTSFFRAGFKGNHLLFWAVLSTFVLQLVVVFVPFVQTLFDTRSLNLSQMVTGCAIASIVLFAVEFEKLIVRRRQRS